MQFNGNIDAPLNNWMRKCPLYSPINFEIQYWPLTDGMKANNILTGLKKAGH